MTGRDTPLRRLASAWPLGVSLAAMLSQPRTDVDAADAAFEGLLRQSVIARVSHHVAHAVRTAWLQSIARSATLRIAVAIEPLGCEGAIRVGSWMLVVASTTALALGASRPTPVGPLSWVLPAVTFAAGLAALSAAAPLARALGGRH